MQDADPKKIISVNHRQKRIFLDYKWEAHLSEEWSNSKCVREEEERDRGVT